MVLSDPAKSGLESGAWVDEYDYQNRTKTLLLRKMSFSRAVYHSKNHVIPQSVIAAIMGVILSILQG